jgi:hypothetical protein
MRGGGYPASAAAQRRGVEELDGPIDMRDRECAAVGVDGHAPGDVHDEP